MQYRFQDWDLGYRPAGTPIRVTLSGNAANVRLLDATNFSAYRSGRSHRYIGGLVQRSPVTLATSHSGHWHLVVDMIGLRGQVRANVEVVPRALPPIRQQHLGPLASISQNVAEIASAEAGPEPKDWDVFISHAHEDKESVVRPLAHALLAEGLRVWYDEFELKLGDSLRRKIDAGLVRSKFGVVVLSQAFFAKNWPQYELDGLVTKEMSGLQVILPLWHHISKAEVMAHSPSLADKVARSTSDRTVEEIAKEIAEVIRS